MDKILMTTTKHERTIIIFKKSSQNASVNTLWHGTLRPCQSALRYWLYNRDKKNDYAVIRSKTNYKLLFQENINRQTLEIYQL